MLKEILFFTSGICLFTFFSIMIADTSYWVFKGRHIISKQGWKKFDIFALSTGFIGILFFVIGISI